MKLTRYVGVVGSREFDDYALLDRTLQQHCREGDILVSGGAKGADSMAQRWAKENGFSILIHYPDYQRFGKGATFARNKTIAEDSDIIFAFYSRGRFKLGGTRNTIEWAQKLNKGYQEYESTIGV